MIPNDYLIIEDNVTFKQEVLQKFMKNKKYHVDTRYTDFLDIIVLLEMECLKNMIYKVVQEAISRDLADFVYNYFLLKGKLYII